jgi:hypothetical protein
MSANVGVRTGWLADEVPGRCELGPGAEHIPDETHTHQALRTTHRVSALSAVPRPRPPLSQYVAVGTEGPRTTELNCAKAIRRLHGAPEGAEGTAR